MNTALEMEVKTDPFLEEKGGSRLTYRSSILMTGTVYYFNVVISSTVTIEIYG